MQTTWRLLSFIHEAKPYPIVTHIFSGMSEQEVRGYYQAHLRSDAFLRECTTRGNYQGLFRCRAVVVIERRINNRWVRVGP